jgi:hypothetical protein
VFSSVALGDSLVSGGFVGGKLDDTGLTLGGRPGETFGPVTPEHLYGYALFTVGPAVSSVPEPSTLTLLSIGSLGLLGYGWRRRKQAVA